MCIFLTGINILFSYDSENQSHDMKKSSNNNNNNNNNNNDNNVKRVNIADQKKIKDTSIPEEMKTCPKWKCKICY